MKIVRTLSGGFPCNICFKDYSSENGLRAHNRTKQLIQLYRCRDCAKEFPHASGLSDHHKRVHIQYKCKKCKKKFLLHNALENT
jgi:DNA-directed RNA polymerase subunit RPC12/RpoP